MYQQFLLSLLINVIVFMTVIIKIDGYIFLGEEDARSFDDQLDTRFAVLHFVNRSDWGASPTTEPVEILNTPVPYVMIYHTGTETCFYRQSCDEIVRRIQAKYSSTNLRDRDIGYNFLISGDGKVYVGCGWETVGAHTLGANKKSIGIALIGTFFDKSPTTEQFYALQKLIRFGILFHFIERQFKYYSNIDVNFSINDKHKISDIVEVMTNSK